MGSEEPALAGTSVMDLRWAFAQVLGEETLARALETLPEETRRSYLGASALSWIPYDVVRAAHDAIAKEAGLTIEGLLRKAVPLAVERSFGTVWRALLRLTSDEALIARTPLMYSRSRSKGKMTARMVRPGEGVAEVTGWPGIPARDILSLEIGIEKILELAKRKNPLVRHERTADGVRFHITLEP